MKNRIGLAPILTPLAIGLLIFWLIGLTGCTGEERQSPVELPESASPAAATTIRTIVLPAEDLELRESGLPGRQLALQKCTICHSVDYIHYQPPDQSLASWTAEVEKMHHSYGAPLSPADIAPIGAYLAVAYGSANGDDADVLAASQVTKQAAVNDVQSLLSSNACLGCHAIDGKLVGPSFREIAEHYKADPQAQVTVAANIRNGGTGKWGQIPMPPMTNLSEAQAQQLAVFVLEQ